MGKRVTMQDIADKLKISKNSVSQALSGKPGVSEATRKKIQQTAKSLGYRYSGAKVNTNGGHSAGNIALIASEFAFSLKSFFGEIYLAIDKEVKKRGMNLHVHSIDDVTRDNLVLPEDVENNSVSGIIVLSHISTDYINKIIDLGIPTVMIDHHHPFNHADAILINNRFAAYKAVHHLIELGHQNIGFVGNVDYSPSYLERWEGYLLALKDNDIEAKKELMVTDVAENGDSINNALNQINELPTAWFCTNDGYGFLILTSLQTRGLRVPKDASVCSFDNGQLSRISTPTTTTMNVDLTLYGKRAIEQLFWRMDNPAEPFQETLIDSNIIIRDSTGPVI
ncbi:LacI family DNA-binding transcriptional regulator [Alteribacter keqinensis]|uniref:LacI family DNA-binding transcriptional regulator n=1 Tax=Alteribacter keqinensis TaxID=2483800 RepID=A0A3M7TPN9_9BACI|nr:LacI family DNA-binding transcriptional regulator [Alteribacter keqinensis]RNA66639.1 LacI family DNA-binding transcriptional regulator [Alteribacter keqinensis]